MFNYKFANIEIKELFKKKVKANGETMQSAITSFINHIIGRGRLIELKRIRYGYTSYEFFSIEKVFIDDLPNGEYHIRVNDDSSIHSALLFFQMNMGGFNVGVVDPILNLDYPLYAKTDDKSLIEKIDLIFTELNKKIKEFRDGN
jgi:hypothetical protein